MKYLRFILPVFVAALILGLNIVIPVSALSENVYFYQDYVISSEVDQDRKLVNCVFPYSLNHVDYNDLKESGFYGSSTGNRYISISVDDLLVENNMIAVEYDLYPINGLLYLPDLPADSTFHFEWYLRLGTSFYDQLWTACQTFVILYDSNGRSISTYFADEFYNQSYQNRINVDVPVSAVPNIDQATYIKFHSFLRFEALLPTGTTTSIQLQVNDFYLTFSLGELAVIIDQNQQLIESNHAIKEALDQIRTGTDEQHAAADKFDNEVNQVVGELDDIGSQMDEVPRETIDVSQLVPTQILQGTHFLTYVDALNNFWDCPEIAIIVVTLGGMILISYLLFGEKG